MKLSSIYEGGSSRELRKRILKGLHAGGLGGIAKELDIPIAQAYKYANLLGGGTYGEDDIDDKEIHRLRAPQNIRKLLKYFEVPQAEADKLTRFILSNHATLKTHRPSPARSRDHSAAKGRRKAGWRCLQAILARGRRGH